MYDAIHSFFEKQDMRVQLIVEDDADLEDIASQQRVNLFVAHAKKKACGSYHGQLARALLMKFGIKSPIKARRKPGMEFPDDGGHWVSYDLSVWIPERWSVNSQRVKGCIFWVNFETYPSFQNMAMTHTREMFKLVI